MAVSGVSGRSTSIYGTRNVITGLASGMDTESMIENAISGYKNKISALTQKRTKTEWQQEAYRSMVNKMSSFLSKYTSYRSSNNLMSTSFFDQAVKTVAKGKYADKVTATGRANSDIQIDRVKQLATAATYKLSGSILDGSTAASGAANVSATADGELKLDGDTTISKLNGSFTLAYGGSNALSYLTVNFDETKQYKDADALVEDINKQLSEQSVSIGTKTYTGKDLLNNVVKAEVGKNGQITFTDPKKNNLYVSAATGSAKELLLDGKEPSSKSDDQIKSLTLSKDALGTKTMNTLDYLSEKGASLSITLDGKTKTIKLPGKSDLNGKTDKASFMAELQERVKKEFGDKITVSDANAEDADKGIQFKFETKQKGSTFSVSSSVGKTLGFGENGQVTSYLNTGRTLGDLLKGKDGIKTNYDGEVDWSQFEVAQVDKKDANGNVIGKEDAKDANGDLLYSFRVNGKEIGQFNKNTSLSTVFNAMNSNSDSGVKVGYSKLTNEISFTAKETGEASDIDFANPDTVPAGKKSLAEALFGKVDKDSEGYKKGQDAIFEASVNGTSLGEITRSSNDVEMDGMTINLKGTFGYDYTQNYTFELNGRSYSASGSDDKLKITSASGNAVKYSSGTSSDMAAFDGKEIYGKYVDGKLSFFVDDDKGNTKELYARKSSGGSPWFSINKGEADALTPAAIKKGETKATPSATEAVSFETSSDADKIVDAVKQMVEDYNAMAKEIKEAYSTLPAQRSNGAYYEPLTAEDEEDMSESAIKNWNEKAKQGLLFGDRDLASLYQRMTSAISMTGENGAALREAGITVSYSNGLSQLEFNEDQFRAALNKDPDKVRDAFTASTEAGAKSNGLMQALKQPLDLYGKTEGGKGVLVEKAGSPLAPSTMYSNTIQKELNNIDDQITRWQERMEDQIDHYTSQFSRLEQLIQQMNSQSSYFSQLMGG